MLRLAIRPIRHSWRRLSSVAAEAAAAPSATQDDQDPQPLPASHRKPMFPTLGKAKMFTEPLERPKVCLPDALSMSERRTRGFPPPALVKGGQPGRARLQTKIRSPPAPHPAPLHWWTRRAGVRLPEDWAQLDLRAQALALDKTSHHPFQINAHPTASTAFARHFASFLESLPDASTPTDPLFDPGASNARDYRQRPNTDEPTLEETLHLAATVVCSLVPRTLSVDALESVFPLFRAQNNCNFSPRLLAMVGRTSLLEDRRRLVDLLVLSLQNSLENSSTKPMDAVYPAYVLRYVLADVEDRSRATPEWVDVEYAQTVFDRLVPLIEQCPEGPGKVLATQHLAVAGAALGRVDFVASIADMDEEGDLNLTRARALRFSQEAHPEQFEQLLSSVSPDDSFETWTNALLYAARINPGGEEADKLFETFERCQPDFAPGLCATTTFLLAAHLAAKGQSDAAAELLWRLESVWDRMDVEDQSVEDQAVVALAAGFLAHDDIGQALGHFEHHYRRSRGKFDPDALAALNGNPSIDQATLEQFVQGLGRMYFVYSDFKERLQTLILS